MEHEKADYKTTKVKERKLYIDLIRLFACFCVITVHFNAAVSGFEIFGFFQYPNSIIPSFYLGAYLGDIGVSLFFMISGASLMISNEHTELGMFYKKRALSIYPMLWIAFIATTALTFILDGKIADVPVWKLIFSFIGYDGYLSTLGLIHGSFYIIGEWFLGCIISIYIIWPLLRNGIQKAPVATWVVSLLLNIVICMVIQPGRICRLWFFIRIPEVLFGMTIVRFKLDRYPLRLFGGALIWACIAYQLMQRGMTDTFCWTVSLCAGIFAFVLMLSRFLDWPALKEKIALTGALMYPIFLVHHRLLYRILKGVDLESLSRKKILLLYIVYVLATLLAAWILKELAQFMMAFFKRVRAADRQKN